MSVHATEPVFVPPTDLEYISLRDEYSFNDQALRAQFIAVSSQINLDNMMLAKQHNFILFRERCDPRVSLPLELFAYDQSPIQPQESQAVKTVVSWTRERARYDLGSEFSKVYPGVQWISEYFVTSSFPAIFGHFVSDEYLKCGLLFIESHISDALAPRLVGTYLLHCFLLRHRLLEIFYQLLVAKQSDPSPDELLVIFIEAFSFAMPYFSEMQITAVQRLREVGEDKAIEAVVTHFLVEAVKVWRFHPLFTTTGLIQKRRPGGSAQSFAHVTYDFVLLDQVKRLGQDRVLRREILDLFVDDVGMEMPAISSIIFYGGIKFPLSVVDLVLLQHLNELHKGLTGSMAKVREIRGNVETAHIDAFRLRARSVHYLPPTVNEPIPTEVSVHLTREKLLEHKAVHDFLFDLAGGLKHFHTVIAAQNHINRLHYYSLAHRLFFAEHSQIQPAAYAMFQRRKYGLQVFDQFVKGVLLEYVRAHTEGSFLEVHEREIGRRIADGIARGDTVVNSILQGTVDYVNGWKQRFNAESTTSQQGMCSASKDHDYPLCQFFADAVDQLVFALTMNRLSTCPFPIVSERIRSEEQREVVSKLLQSMSQPSVFVEFAREQFQDDADIAILMENSTEAKFLLMKAEQAAMASFARGEIKWGSGDHILLFLEIESLLRPIMTSEILVEMLRHDPNWGRRLMSALFNAENPLFLRAFLSTCLMIVRLLREQRNPLVENLAEIGNPITQEIIRAFGNLREWFDFKEDVFPAE
jgi:hypothetical protein